MLVMDGEIFYVSWLVGEDHDEWVKGIGDEDWSLFGSVRTVYDGEQYEHAVVYFSRGVPGVGEAPEGRGGLYELDWKKMRLLVGGAIRREVGVMHVILSGRAEDTSRGMDAWDETLKSRLRHVKKEENSGWFGEEGVFEGLLAKQVV